MVWAVALSGVAIAALVAQACSFPDIKVEEGTGGAAGGSSQSTGGGAPACTMATQCPTSPTECKDASCIDSACGFTNKVPGTRCAADTKLCDASGACVECLVLDDCSGTDECKDGSCVAATCSNMANDPGETGIDCGGSCAPCPLGGGCLGGTDCQSGFCQGGGGAGGAGGGGASGMCAECGSDADCSDLDDTYCEAKACVPKKAQGVSCTAPGQCLSGFCPAQDLVCCDEACSPGECISCDGMLTNSPTGNCGFIKENTDPDNECLLACGAVGCQVL
jgi:hypothetical protein